MLIHTVPPHFFQDNYPAKLLSSLKSLQQVAIPIYLAGGAVRDLLIGKKPTDLDLTVAANGVGIAQFFASQLGGKYIVLDEEEEVARVVWRDFCVDFTTFREKSESIADDLGLRDFTINAMAVQFDFRLDDLLDWTAVIDPCNGRYDLSKGIIRQTHKNGMVKDPLRVIRAYRFLATVGESIDFVTKQSIRENCALLDGVSVERISTELDKIITSSRAHRSFALMAQDAVLPMLFPEVVAGQNVKQPGSHHLDVFEHNLATLKEMEKIILKSGPVFLNNDVFVHDYLQSDAARRKWLKWASFFHDLGKPNAGMIRRGRMTFYGHDNVGATIFGGIARRLRWSNIDASNIGRFIKHHMWFFHLANSQKKTGLKPRACLKIYKALGDNLPGLYLLAQADSLAAQGPDKPAGMEESLAQLYQHIRAVIDAKVEPVFVAAPVLSGKDLIDFCHLQPGPLFGEILLALEQEQVENGKMSKSAALAWVDNFLRSRGQRVDEVSPNR